MRLDDREGGGGAGSDNLISEKKCVHVEWRWEQFSLSVFWGRKSGEGRDNSSSAAAAETGDRRASSAVELPRASYIINRTDEEGSRPKVGNRRVWTTVAFPPPPSSYDSSSILQASLMLMR